MTTTTTGIERPGQGEYNPYYQRYLTDVPDGDLLELLQLQGAEMVSLLRSISEDKSTYRYEPGKWSVREVVGHVVDTERVFTYRALAFARGEKAPLPSFDENQWAGVSNAAHRRLADLTDECIAVRAATLALFRGLAPADFARAGVASDSTVTVRALAWITAGHERHHLRLLRERYKV